MKHKVILKIVVDIGMTVMLLFLMPYKLFRLTVKKSVKISIFKSDSITKARLHHCRLSGRQSE